MGRRWIGPVLAGVLVGCAGVSAPTVTVPSPLVGEVLVPPQTGLPSPAGFQTTMTPAALVGNATVSLIPVTGTTSLASTQTDVNGHFTLTAPTAVAANTAFYAIASKRPAALAARLNLRTLVLWDGAAWQSISRLNSANVHVINPTTTAVSILHASTPAKAGLPGEVLGTVAPGGGGLYDQIALWGGGGDAAANLLAAAFTTHMTINLLSVDRDPVSGFAFVTGVHPVGRSGVQTATTGETTVAIDGYGFDVQPDQNIVSFTTGTRTALATPTSASTTTQLIVRVPDYLPPDAGGVAPSTLVGVSNRTGAAAYPVAGWGGLRVYPPQVISDAATVINDIATASTLNSGFLSGAYDAVTGRGYAAWIDKRFFASNGNFDSVVVRSWKDTAIGTTALVSTSPSELIAARVEQEAARSPVVVADTVNGRAHVVWEGKPYPTGTRTVGVFHRVFLPTGTPPWLGGLNNSGGDARNVADVGLDATPKNCRDPIAATDGAKVLVAYKRDSPTQGDVFLRLWNGTSVTAADVGRPDWGNGTARQPTNVSSSAFESMFPNLAVGGPGGGWRYHLAWVDRTKTDNLGNLSVTGDVLYARGQDTGGGVLSIQPTPVATTGPPSAVRLSTGQLAERLRPAMAADSAGNVLVVWKESAGLRFSHIPYNGATITPTLAALVPGTGPTALHTTETTPTIAAGGSPGEFYLVSSTTSTLPVGDGMELFIRRYAGGTWTTSRVFRPSSAISSEVPWLIARGSDLGLLWVEGRKILHLPLVWPLDAV